MKHLLIVIFVLGSYFSFGQTDTTNLNWYTNLEKAQQVSKKKSKPILMYFTGSDWCSPCVELKKDFFETPAFISMSEGYVLVLIDYPRREDIITPEQKKYNKKIIDIYNKEGSFPRLTVLNHKGKELGSISSYSSFNTSHDVSHHVAFVKKYLKN